MLTGEKEFLDQARIMGLHGMSKDALKRYDKGGSWFYEVLVPGFKYNMTDIAASLGLVQLKRMDEMQARRRAIQKQYRSAIEGHPLLSRAIETPVERKEVEHAWHLFPIRLKLDALNIGRDQFIEELKARNIATSVHFIPVHLHPYYREKYSFKPEAFPVAYAQYQRLISIPFHPRLTDAEVTDVIDALVDVVQGFIRS